MHQMTAAFFLYLQLVLQVIHLLNTAVAAVYFYAWYLLEAYSKTQPVLV